MNRKNTILIAILINAGLLAVLLIASLTTQEEIITPSPVVAEAPLSFPQFDDQPIFNHEIPLVNLPAEPKPEPLSFVIAESEPLVHKLPPLTPEPSPAPIAVAPPPAPAAQIAASAQVTVKKGDSLEKIAKVHHTTVDEIIKINHLPSTFLKIGQVLKIPTERSLATAKAPEKKAVEPIKEGPEYYTMKVGENPWAIAVKHRMKVEELLRLNALNEEKARKLKPGDRLRIR